MPSGDSNPSIDARRPFERRQIRATGVGPQHVGDRVAASVFEPDQIERSGDAQSLLVPEIAAIEPLEQPVQPGGGGRYFLASNRDAADRADRSVADGAIEEPGELLDFERGAVQPEHRVSSHHLEDERSRGCRRHVRLLRSAFAGVAGSNTMMSTSFRTPSSPSISRFDDRPFESPAAAPARRQGQGWNLSSRSRPAPGRAGRPGSTRASTGSASASSSGS